MSRQHRASNLTFLLLALVIFLCMNWIWRLNRQSEELVYSEVVQLFEQEKVSSFSFSDGNTLTLTLRDQPEGQVQYHIYDFSLFYSDLNDLVRDQKARGVITSYNYPPPETTNWLELLLPWILTALVLGALFYFMVVRTQGGGMGPDRMAKFGAARTRMLSDQDKKVTFDDVAGADEVKEELEEIVEFLKSPKKFNEIGAKIPKGVLLYGPPGTGKTLLARAVAGEAGVAFFSISGSDFVEMFVGVGASRVRDLFEQAKKNAPCIIFIDEIDAVGRQRGAGVGGGHDEREQTLNQLLVEMDGFNSNEGIIILAATNRPDILDPALLRPGRFDRQVTVDRPDVKGREEILKVHVRKTPLASDVDLAVIAKQTAGFTGADLANLVNEAALLSARLGLKKVGQQQLEQSIERVIAGPEKKSRAMMSEYEKNLVSYHEAGHALLGYLLPECDPVHKVSIIPRGRAGGYTLLLPTEDRNYMTRTHLRHQIIMMLGGRVAEEIVLHEISTGASNDIERATSTIRRMITEWGMSDELGTITFGNNNNDQVFLGRDLGRDRNYSEAVAYSIDKEVKRMMDDCHAEARRLLSENLEKLTLIAETLKERETIQADEFMALMEGRSLEELDAQKEDLLREQKGLAKKETPKPDTKKEPVALTTEEAPAQEPEKKDDWKVQI